MADNNFIRNWIGLFILGSINNLPYVIVTSAAKTIADSFNERNQVGLVFGANVALSVLVKGINGFFLLKVKYWIRYAVNAALMLIGLFGVAYSFSFWFALVCIVFVGASAAFGENVALGFCRLFPSKLVNAWSSGTGMAGLLGSGIYIIFGCVVGAGGQNQVKLHHLTNYAFLLTTPAVVLYLVAYFFIIKRPKRDEGSEGSPGNIQQEEEIKQKSNTDDAKSSLTTVEESTGRRIFRCLKLVLWMAFNLCAVYMFEYVAQGCAAKVRPKSEYNIGCPELYAALSLCYQAGVFVSRSSVQLMQIRRVEILTILQFLNMVVWIVDVHLKFLPVYVLPAYMIFVGLLGGASYVNIFYQLLNDEKYPEKDRELCINIAALFINLDIEDFMTDAACGAGNAYPSGASDFTSGFDGGIILGTLLETLLFNTALKSD